MGSCPQDLKLCRQQRLPVLGTPSEIFMQLSGSPGWRQPLLLMHTHTLPATCKHGLSRAQCWDWWGGDQVPISALAHNLEPPWCLRCPHRPASSRWQRGGTLTRPPGEALQESRLKSQTKFVFRVHGILSVSLMFYGPHVTEVDEHRQSRLQTS